jgi:diphthamide synthase (EF-2-diphthine--ammonia ligase)
MHAVRRTLLRAQARAACLPLIEVDLPYPCSNDDYEARMRGFVSQALELGVTAVAFGDLFLEDVRAYRVRQLEGTGLSPVFPLWGRATPALAREMIASGLQAHLTCVDPRQIDARFAGRAFDQSLLDELPAHADPCGERGEFHTFVSAGPMFDEPISVIVGEVVEREGFVFADLLLDPNAPGSAAQ